MYNQPMYFFKSIEAGSDPKLEDGQILIKNVSNRSLRCATPPFMVQPNGFAVVSDGDPVCKTRLVQGLIVKVDAAVSTVDVAAMVDVATTTSESTTSWNAVKNKGSKKSQKKNVEEVVVEETAVEETAVEETVVEETVVQEIVAETASETNKEITVSYDPKEVQY